MRRLDGTSYIEHDWDILGRMLDACLLEGVGPQNGTIRYLRMLTTPEDAFERIRVMHVEKSSGSIITQASREVFRERLSDTLWTWAFKKKTCHKANRNLERRAA